MKMKWIVFTTIMVIAICLLTGGLGAWGDNLKVGIDVNTGEWIVPDMEIRLPEAGTLVNFVAAESTDNEYTVDSGDSAGGENHVDITSDIGSTDGENNRDIPDSADGVDGNEPKD